MIPFLILISGFAISLGVTKLFLGTFKVQLSGRIAMSLMLLFTAMGHFMFPKGMVMMIPAFLPMKEFIVYLTGTLEIAAAVGLLIPKLRTVTGWLLLVFFIMVLPANIHAAIHHINYQQGTFDGHGPTYLLFRVPLQILFCTWVYFSAVKRKVKS